MTLQQVIDRDHLARKIVLAYQDQTIDRNTAWDGLYRLHWSQKKINDMLDLIDSDKVRFK